MQSNYYSYSPQLYTIPQQQPQLQVPQQQQQYLQPSNTTLDESSIGTGGTGEEYDSEESIIPDKRAGRRKIKIEYIHDKSRRHITFSKRKAGIMKKAYELSTLTGTQILLLVVSETGLVYTFTTPKLQPLVTKPEGKNLIQSCLNAPDPADTSSMDQSLLNAPSSSATATSSRYYHSNQPVMENSMHKYNIKDSNKALNQKVNPATENVMLNNKQQPPSYIPTSSSMIYPTFANNPINNSNSTNNSMYHQYNPNYWTASNREK
ncbi:hypothetical protein G6F70_004659 [Rhizopus microsporus]|uniref:Transcription factor of the MADS box n=1 Tax=Rhizopus azygosporus TaxID=86630 RepID=A0A367K530_RHIAZ|nr:hypothetical protein G6F71_004718 [Rhizopus microsporus]RCH96971.1 transcription factor of the MADS box [Rhizopus azygosporus]KAG1199726.1 hypothetical protein G6F70_004659 [Rhizopus microsporus]KAG1211460.1 hypothetical protein G6F69_004568 [Rhizopus microsporus]KAG1233385.1 hypothetical protein G6F67_004306 [Rhizopus microsporus]